MTSAPGFPRRPFLWLVLAGLGLSACHREAAAPKPAKAPGAAEPPAAGARIAVAAAADLKFALDEVIEEFRKSHPSTQVETTYGSSGNFFAQLSNKAPFDLYLSADMAYPRKLIEAGQAVKESEFPYAVGQIVIWVRNESSLDVQKGMDLLKDPAVKKIAIANPQHAPYGRAAEAALKHYGVYDDVKGRLVLGENIAQTAQFVDSGGADVGIIALSLALAPAMAEKGAFWPVPLEAYPPLEQGGVILNWARDRAATEELRAFLMGEEGRTILKRYGFILPEH